MATLKIFTETIIEQFSTGKWKFIRDIDKLTLQEVNFVIAEAEYQLKTN